MKSFGNSMYVDTKYKIGLRTLIIVGVLFNVILSIAVFYFVGQIFNHKPLPMLITTAILILFSLLDSYYLLGFLIKPINLAARRLLLLAEGDLRSDRVAYTHLTETSVMVRALNTVIDNNNKYINEIKRVLHEFENKNLAVEVKTDFIGDFSAIKTSLVNIIEFLNDTMGQIRSSSNEVASGADLVSNGATTLSQGATEQASAIEELTASLEDISSQTALNAQNAEKASQLASSAKTEAEQGNDRMNLLLKAMDAINASSGNINKIIKVIDDIAFQTNILALNAAVEAARAGQHGKGFAVVAEEVRTLAGKSANAVKDTTEMIDGSIRNVESGIKIANETAGALKRIVTEVSKATELVGAIAIASKEQAMGIEQLNQGILQVSQVVQNNAATSEESAAASEELSSQADQLKEVVSAFQVKNTQAYEPARLAAASVQRQS
jgi:methyl-accepting chemotaxis protein